MQKKASKRERTFCRRFKMGMKLTEVRRIILPPARFQLCQKVLNRMKEASIASKMIIDPMQMFSN